MAFKPSLPPWLHEEVAPPAKWKRRGGACPCLWTFTMINSYVGMLPCKEGMPLALTTRFDCGEKLPLLTSQPIHFLDVNHYVHSGGDPGFVAEVSCGPYRQP